MQSAATKRGKSRYQSGHRWWFLHKAINNVTILFRSFAGCPYSVSCRSCFSESLIVRLVSVSRCKNLQSVSQRSHHQPTIIAHSSFERYVADWFIPTRIFLGKRHFTDCGFRLQYASFLCLLSARYHRYQTTPPSSDGGDYR